MNGLLSVGRDVSYDVRISARRLSSRPLVSAAIVFTFGLAVALATTIYSVAHSVLLRPLPYTDPDRLLSIWRTTPAVDFVPLPVPELFDLRSRAASLDSVAGFAPTGFGVRLADRTVWADAFEVTPNWFAVLGVAPMLGRTFQEDEDVPGQNVIIVTEHFWRTELGADPRIIGARLQLADTDRSGSAVEVVGVVRDDMEFSYPTKLRPLAYVVRAFTPADVADAARMVPELIAVARVRRDVKLAAAAEQVRTVLSESVRQHPTTSIPNVATRAISLHEEMVGRTRPVFVLLAAAAIVVLVIAAINVAAVTVGMASMRRREFAVRLALGSTITRLIRALLLEHLLLAFASVAVAIVITAWMMPVVRELAPVLLPRVNEIRFAGSSLWFATTVSLAGSLAFAVAPALALVKYASISGLGLREEIGVGGRRQRVAMVTVVTQAALVFALLASAAAISRGLWRLAHIDLGFDPKHVLVAELTLTGETNAKLPEIQIIDSVRAVPGVTGVSTASDLPFSFGILLPVESPKGKASRAVVTAVGGEYFELMKMNLIRGRTIGATDAGNRAVVVINESLARAVGVSSAIGERIKIGSEWREVIGTVRDVTELGSVRGGVIRQPGFTRLILPTAYIPRTSEAAGPRTFLLARTSSSPDRTAPAVQRALHGVGASVIIRRINSLDERVATPAMDARFAGTVIAAYGLVALLIASLGLYGLLTHVVRQRTREVAVRMALGATTRDVLRSMIGGTLGSVAAGLVPGLLLALAAGRYLRPWLFETRAADGLAILGAGSVLLVIGAIAAVSPAHHVSQVDPARALRAE